MTKKPFEKNGKRVPRKIWTEISMQSQTTERNKRLSIDNSNHSTPPQLLTTEEVAEITRTSVSYWERQRTTGGPNAVPFVKIGRRVRYRREAINEWLSDRTFRCTSEESYS